jgi:phage N-6-adenine-methyltransferase
MAAARSLAVEIRAEIAAFEADLRSAVGHAIRGGQLLIEAKEGLPHGEWEPWLAANFDRTPQWARAWMRLARNREQIESAVSVSSALRELVSGDAMDVHHSSASSDWGTPQELFDALDQEFGFDFDVCATPQLAKCARYFSPEADGLAQEWTGTCWMNPPYGDEIGAWVAKAHDESRRGVIVVCLLPARTDTGWWHEHVRYAEHRFLRGRLRFEGADDDAPFPSAVVVIWPPCVDSLRLGLAGACGGARLRAAGRIKPPQRAPPRHSVRPPGERTKRTHGRRRTRYNRARWQWSVFGSSAPAMRSRAAGGSTPVFTLRAALSRS